MMLFFSRHTNDILSITITVGVYNLLMVLGYWYIYWKTSGMDPYDETDSTQKNTGPSIWDMLVLSLKNPPLLLLILSEVFRSAYLLVITAFAHYYFKYVLNEYGFLSYFILAISIARLSGTVVSSWIGVKIGKRHAYWTSLVLTAIGFGSAIFWSDNVWSFTIIFCVASMLGMIAGSMVTALFSDTVVYGEWASGVNIRAFTMGLQSFSIKVGILIRSAVVYFGLRAIGFVANADPSAGVVEGIRSIMIFTPAAACVTAAAIFFFGYKLDDAHILRMQDEIVSRKAGDSGQ
jgi:GPH family glycoside/pentoside/hexuronide:cation symporter